MAILGAMQSAATRLIGRRPSVFFGATGEFEVEICDLINEVAHDIVSYADWQELTSLNTIEGDGETEVFDLPSDYEKMLLDSEVQRADGMAWGYCHVPNINDFIALKNSGFGPYPGAWTIYGGKMHFAPAPVAGIVSVFPYIRKTYAVDSATGVAKDAFNSDTDGFPLPERLLTLGLVWRWREMKRLDDSSADYDAFKKAISEYSAKDSGPTVIRKGGGRRFHGVGVAWPWKLG